MNPTQAINCSLEKQSRQCSVSQATEAFNLSKSNIIMAIQKTVTQDQGQNVNCNMRV